MKPFTKHSATPLIGDWKREETGILFDFGGTLDTHGCHWGKFLWHAYQHQQIPVDEEMFRSAYVYTERTLGKKPIIQPDFTFHQTLETKIQIEFEYLVEHGLVSGSSFFIARMQASILDDIYNKVKTNIAESRAILLQLKKKARLALVSNFYGNIRTVLEELNIADLFETVVESAICGVRKPDPKIFRLGIDTLGLKPEQTTVIGDSYKNDITPAHALGCHTVWLKGEGWNADKPEKKVADRIIGSIADLSSLSQ